MRKPIPQPLALALLAASVVATSGLALFAVRSNAADPAPAAPTARPALTVTVAQPTRSALPVTLAANGSVAAWQEAVIGSEASGLRLTEVRASVGDWVQAGQVLATFSSATPRAEVAQARASLLEAEAAAADAKANAARARTLENSGALSQSQINQYLTAAQTSRARVAAAKAVLDAQQLRLGFAEVRAPDSGVISSRSATVGAVVGPGAELFRMVRRGRLEWRAEVTAADLGRVRPGTRATVYAASGAPMNGTVRSVAPTVDPQTRMGLVYVDLPTPAHGAEGPAKAGMFARGTFALGNSQALTVPQAAVVVREAFSYVFAVGPDGRVAQRKVQVGRQLGDRVEVASGLEPEARIVVRGAGFLADGDLVRIVEDSPANPAPAQAKPATAATK
ncbi:MAG: efflux RND transporter periplasmic adaptor subunit [Xylophilus ampelinus]